MKALVPYNKCIYTVHLGALYPKYNETYKMKVSVKIKKGQIPNAFILAPVTPGKSHNVGLQKDESMSNGIDGIRMYAQCLRVYTLSMCRFK